MRPDWSHESKLASGGRRPGAGGRNDPAVWANTEGCRYHGTWLTVGHMWLKTWRSWRGFRIMGGGVFPQATDRKSPRFAARLNVQVPIKSVSFTGRIRV